MINLITPQYYWPHINLDISKFVKHCNVCQLNKRKRQKRFGLLQTVPPTDQPFEYISIDTVGGFNYYNSTKKFLHLIIDHATRYVWAFASKSETTETYANCLKQLFQIQIPSKLLTDRNGAFTSSRFKHFLRNYNVKQLLTTYHPQTNGKCERVNQSIVTKLRCKRVTKFPPAYLLFGTLPYTPPLAQNQVYPPVEEARKLAKENTIKYHEKNKIKYDARFIDSPFEPALALSTMQVTVRFLLDSIPIQREKTLDVVRGLPPLSLQPNTREDLRLDGYLEYPHAAKAILHLKASHVFFGIRTQSLQHRSQRC
ncbi:hypothetical protein TNCV_2291361 [Trichonephila clavipes]|uniref:RNA-directed DNA polymerase n=1 Tax=Trichonephila clavipes TaxID=2585209 RepID=A0A8X6RJR4_TRICX|nr:hypothetical protein TNCV_2291361 [Trichonephila clavipes]